jgi:hypothetical protein
MKTWQIRLLTSLSYKNCLARSLYDTCFMWMPCYEAVFRDTVKPQHKTLWNKTKPKFYKCSGYDRAVEDHRIFHF